MDPFNLICSLLFGVIGMAAFAHGKKNLNLIVLSCGVILMVFPYVVSNNIALVVIGTALTAVAWYFRN